MQPAAVAAQPAAVPQIDWAAIAETSPVAIPDATPFTQQLLPTGWCHISCTPCPCSPGQGFCQRFACIGGN